LACHDLRTPLATAHGFARTLQRVATLGPTEARYVEMIEAAAEQIADLVESLALVARIEAGRYSPALQQADTLGLANAARERVGGEHVEVRGRGGVVSVDPGPTERALAAFADCIRRHGGVDPVQVEAREAQLALSPVPQEAVPVVLADDLRDLGAAAAHVVVNALGGSVELTDDTLVVSLPPTSGF
jgi:signal transduction histidine kinase